MKPINPVCLCLSWEQQCVRKKRHTLPSHHWVQQVLGGQQDLGLPGHIEQIGLRITITSNLCSQVSGLTAFNMLWHVYNSHKYIISFLSSSWFDWDKMCEDNCTYSCTIISSCTFWSFFTNCALYKRKAKRGHYLLSLAGVGTRVGNLFCGDTQF